MSYQVKKETASADDLSNHLYFSLELIQFTLTFPVEKFLEGGKNFKSKLV